MLNLIWAGMIGIGIIYGAFTGNLKNVGDACIDSGTEAVTLCITMLGVMAFWCGMMKISESSGLTKRMERGIKPVIKYMFPEIPDDHSSLKYISINVISNILGLGWAATPAGLKAMSELSKLDIERSTKSNMYSENKLTQGYTAGNLDIQDRPTRISSKASDEMCTFLILNISSLQLIPVNIIAYRSQYGSVNPTAVVGPGIIATALSTLVAVVFCKIMCYTKKKKGGHIIWLKNS